MRRIELSKGKIALVDDEDYERLSKHRWHAISPKNDGGRFYAAARVGRRGPFIYMHKMILGSSRHVDHVNNDSLDNRRKNLRPCNQSQNNANSRKRSVFNGLISTSRFKGVSLTKSGTWQAGLKCNGVRVRKTFKSELAAAVAYDHAARKHFGAFARLNFPYGVG